jgi:hypothetical protein
MLITSIDLLVAIHPMAMRLSFGDLRSGFFALILGSDMISEPQQHHTKNSATSIIITKAISTSGPLSMRLG